MSAQAAWVQPGLAAAGAAAGVLQQAADQGAFTLPPALAGIMGALSPRPGAPPPPTRTVASNTPPPEAPQAGPWTVSGILGRIKERPMIALAVAAVVVLLGWLALRKG